MCSSAGVPDARCFDGAVRALSASLQWQRALALLIEDASRYQVQADVATYNAVALACEKEHQWERSLDLMTEMNRAHVKPEASMYTSVILGCLSGSEWQRALDLLGELER